MNDLSLVYAGLAEVFALVMVFVFSVFGRQVYLCFELVSFMF
jgi:hypothetical protein